MSDASPQDQQQFEQVLSRLDALIRRSHHEAAPLPPLAEETPRLELAVPLAESLQPDELSGPHTPFVVVESTPIPILTEIYQGDTASPQLASTSPTTPASANISPALMALVDRAIQEEMAQLQQSLALRLHREIAALLQPSADASAAPTNQQD